MNTMHVEDFVVLGRTVPEESKKYGKKVCMAGYSAVNNQFLRVYPLMLPVGANHDSNAFKARHRYALDLQRNPDDNRGESWRVADERRPTSTPWAEAKEVPKAEIVKWLKTRVVPTIKCLNECRLSLGVVLLKADGWEGLSVERTAPDDQAELRTLFDDLEDQATVLGRQEFDPKKIRFAPYIKYRDAANNHRLQVREWGAFILVGNPQYANDPDALWNANGYKRGKATFAVIGNMTNHRNNWLIIKLFQEDQKTASLFQDAGS